MEEKQIIKWLKAIEDEQQELIDLLSMLPESSQNLKILKFAQRIKNKIIAIKNYVGSAA